MFECPLSEINPMFSQTHVVLVVGANDVVNPSALSTESSPIVGMPVLYFWEADWVIVSKRSLNPGHAGIPTHCSRTITRTCCSATRENQCKHW
ncbi:NAD(P)(+) transhydrogenase (Re/Si-specific) subunit beta [Salinigranum halophilum]|uniref:NAD(P)(+) transhydrogenase (Re/Si-specific) subunit beta n=1 Tax=Salinigranum halophilum TaxID=2565931 RepID=UPI003742ECF1